jgi:hypothetical protein
MKFQDTEFARQMLSAIIGSLLLVATVAFVSVPISLGCSQGGTDGCTAASAQEWHLT